MLRKIMFLAVAGIFLTSTADMTGGCSSSSGLSAPTGVVAVGGDSTVTLTWDAVAGATSYHVYMAEVTGVTAANYATLSGGMKHENVTSPYVHTGLVNGTMYYFVVTAVGGSGESSASTEVTGRPRLSAVDLAVGSLHACAVTDGGEVFCWGDDDYGELGNGTTSDGSSQRSPVQVLDEAGTGFLTGVRKVAAAESQTCAATDVGEVWCWGNDDFFQLGNGASLAESSLPTQVLDTTGSGPLTGVVDVVAGVGHTCALTDAGEVLCWGTDSGGQLGNGAGVTDSELPMQVLDTTGSAPLTGVVQIAAGGDDTCAVTDAKELLCWGYDTSGVLGNGPGGGQHLPGFVLSEDGSAHLTGVVQVSANSEHTCAVTEQGAALCWGSDFDSKLGNGGSEVDSHLPVLVRNTDDTGSLENVTQITTGGSHACAVIATGEALCWGRAGISGVLGNGLALSVSPIPTFVVGSDETSHLTGISRIESGYNSVHTCVLTNDSEIFCWGEDISGQLGNGGSAVNSTSPVSVLDATGEANLSGVVQVVAGNDYSCALLTSGQVSCWGGNSYGQLGHGEDADIPSAIPVTVLDPSGGSTPLSNVTQIAAGDSHACAVLGDGRVVCWGNDADAQLGDDSVAAPFTRTPVYVLNESGNGPLTSITQVTAGLRHTCALKEDGTILCWGANDFGSLGNGSPGVPSSLPWPVSNITGGVTQIDAGAVHTCALMDTGEVQCWGSDSSGELGNGAGGNTSTPGFVLKVSGPGNLSNITQIAAGDAHTCALFGTGEMTCWGSDNLGALGNDSALSSNQQRPVMVKDTPGTSDLFDVAHISVGFVSTCAVTTSGGILCWGVSGNSGRTLPVALVDEASSPVTGIADIDTGGMDHSCAVTTASEAMCWGDGFRGRLGNGELGYSEIPDPVSGFW